MLRKTFYKQCYNLFSLIALLIFSSVIHAGTPPTKPILRIEAGMHTATIRAVSTDASGRYAVTASDDKLARIWDTASGKLLQVLRPPIGSGNEGKLFAVAMSPDSHTVAVGGWTGWDWEGKGSVYLFNRSSSQLIQRITGLPSGIYNLSFSPDGLYLAASLSGVNGIRVWRISPDGVANTTAMAATGYSAVSYGAAWSNDGRLATTSYDGKIRLYKVGRSLQTLATVSGAGGKQAYGIAFSPNGRELAVSYYDSTRVDILDGQSLALRHTPSSAGVDYGNLSKVAWSADGNNLVAAGTWWKDGNNPLRYWPQAGRGQPRDVPLTNGTIMGLHALPDGRILVGSGDPIWGIFNPKTGSTSGWQSLGKSPVADLRNSTGDYGFALSNTGKQLQFGFEPFVKSPHRFDLYQRRLQAGQDTSLSNPDTTGLAIKDWKLYKPSLNGKPVTLDQYEQSHSLAIAPSARSFVLGTSFKLRHYSRDGSLLWQQYGSGVVWGVNISPSGKLLVAAYGDGTIRWHRLSDGKELLAFFPHADRERWVLWTPSGYYDASTGAEDLIGWHVNNGADSAADFFPASRFRERFWRPDIIDRVLDTLDEDAAIAQANAARGTRTDTTTSVAQILPPVVDLLSNSQLRSSSKTVTVNVQARTNANAPVTSWTVRVNGQLQPDARGLGRVGQSNKANSGKSEARTVQVTIPAQDSVVQIFASNRHGTSTAATVNVQWVGQTPKRIADGSAFVIKPKLYVLAVGVANYDDSSIPDLGLSAKDAEDFVTAIKGQKNKLYREVEVRLLTEQNATGDNVIDGLDWLQKQVTQHDIGMVFIAGHGINDPVSGYNFLPVDANPDRLRRTGVAMHEFKTTLANLTGKAVFFIDTCHSGNVLGTKSRAVYNDITGVINELSSADNGVVVFSSSTGRQLSLENSSWGNGAFTKAVVEGINGKAAYQNDGRITIKMLDLYVSERVKELTKGQQSPVTQAPGGVPDFPLAVVK